MSNIFEVQKVLSKRVVNNQVGANLILLIYPI